jgi:hypothetical protein
VGTSQKRDDAVGLPKLLGPEHNSLVAVERHATFSLQTGLRPISTRLGYGKGAR